jgi:hypothetical protein
MSERRLRTAVRKKRERRKFLEDHAEHIRLAIIGGVVVAIVLVISKFALT